MGEVGIAVELGLLVLNCCHHYHSILCPPQMRGEAEAFAIGARARAEAEQMAKKAEAFQLYQEAAQLDMLLEKLPQVWSLSGYQESQGKRVGEVRGLRRTQLGDHKLGVGVISQ